MNEPRISKMIPMKNQVGFCISTNYFLKKRIKDKLFILLIFKIHLDYL